MYISKNSIKINSLKLKIILAILKLKLFFRNNRASRRINKLIRANKEKTIIVCRRNVKIDTINKKNIF